MPPPNPMTLEPIPTADELRTAFDAPAPLTVGLEEELMLLDPETLDLLPRAARGGRARPATRASSSSCPRPSSS